MNREEKRAYTRKWQLEHKEQTSIYARRYKQNHKDTIKASSQMYYQAHKDEKRAYQRKYGRELKEKVLTYYGNGGLACVRCGFSDSRALSLDHMNGGGRQEKISLGRMGGNSFYSWLVSEGYPKGYQTLCMNCNIIKRFENSEGIAEETNHFVMK